MRNLINFIIKHNFVVIFILLQFFCIFLISKQNFHHRSLFVNSSSYFFGNINFAFNSISEYFRLKKINEQLAKENAFLKSMHISSFMFETDDYFFRDDTLFNRKFTFIPAKVINSSISKQNNYLTLNIGSKKGVEPGMGIIGPSGVVGIITDVSENFASALSILHFDTKISGKVSKSNAIGTVIWNGINFREAELIDVSKFHEVNIGDTVFTSGFSKMFPADIPIGTVKELEPKEATDFFNIKIELSTDYSALSNVYIVKNHISIEQIKLEEESQND